MSSIYNHAFVFFRIISIALFFSTPFSITAFLDFALQPENACFPFSNTTAYLNIVKKLAMKGSLAAIAFIKIHSLLFSFPLGNIWIFICFQFLNQKIVCHALCAGLFWKVEEVLQEHPSFSMSMDSVGLG
eukprot:NODE_903_length_3231_cov_0.607280.p1 type:complete len:130 gc:universal NODE_903_length_3231_cov_0.607280:468-857(+)